MQGFDWLLSASIVCFYNLICLKCAMGTVVGCVLLTLWIIM